MPSVSDSPPVDELQSAEAALAVLQDVLHGVANDEWTKQTPCREFDVAGLTDHLMNSIAAIGAAPAAPRARRPPSATGTTRWNGRSSSLRDRRWTPGATAAWTAPSRSARTRRRRR